MTPSCAKKIDRAELGRFRDGELAPPAAASLAAHVEGCAQCQAVLADLEALGELLVAQRALFSADSGNVVPDFAARVMASLPPERASAREGWTEFVRRHRDALVLSFLGVAIAASMLVVFAPGLRSDGSRVEEAAENEAQIHQLAVSGGEQNAVVLQSAEGNTVIWMVAPAEEEDAGNATPPSP
jgi:anti-sigma factor RsiW